MLTLHSYILRELLKIFLLTLVGLTALFTMGGGLFNAVRYEGVTSTDMLRMMPMLLPIALTVTMPVSALFAATMLYGRMAADNELTACRAAGINVHRLLLSAVLLSVLVASLMSLAANRFVPELVGQLDRYIRSNIRELAFAQLRTKGYVRYPRGASGQIMLTADGVENVADEAIIRHGFEPPSETRSYFWIAGPRCIDTDSDGNLRRFASAEGALCEFDVDDGVRITVHLSGGRSFEIGERTLRLGSQRIGPYEVNLPIPQKPAMASAAKLRAWRDAPWTAPDIQKRVRAYRAGLRHSAFFRWAAQIVGEGRPIVLRDPLGHDVSVQAGSYAFPERARYPVLRDVVVTEQSPGGTITYQAPQATLLVRVIDDGAMTPTGGVLERAADTASESAVEIRLEEVGGKRIVESHAGARQRPTELRDKRELIIDRLALPTEVLNEAAAVKDADIFDATPLPPELEDTRASIQADAAVLRRKVASLLHFRWAFSGSSLVTIVMGAALGIIFRGSRALAAIGLAAVPFLCAWVVTLMGRQLTDGARTHDIGPWVTWGGLAVFVVANALLLRFGVRR